MWIQTYHAQTQPWGAGDRLLDVNYPDEGTPGIFSPCEQTTRYYLISRMEDTTHVQTTQRKPNLPTKQGRCLLCLQDTPGSNLGMDTGQSDFLMLVFSISKYSYGTILRHTTAIQTRPPKCSHHSTLNMKQSPSSGLILAQLLKKFLPFMQSKKSSNVFKRSLKLVHILSQMNSFHTLPICLRSLSK